MQLAANLGSVSFLSWSSWSDLDVISLFQKKTETTRVMSVTMSPDATVVSLEFCWLFRVFEVSSVACNYRYEWHCQALNHIKHTFYLWTPAAK